MGDARAEVGGRLVKALDSVLVAVVAEDALEAPTGLLQVARNATRKLRGLRRDGIVVRADDKLGPGKGGVAVDRAQLPDGALVPLSLPT